MTVSVVMTTYNHEPYIIEAIDSIIQQSYEDIEIVLVDDGSTYNIDEKLSDYSTKKLRVIKLNGVGTSEAINIGIAESCGEYIALFSGDDISHKNRVSSQIEILRDRNNVILFCVPNIIDGNGTYRADDACPYFARGRTKRAKHDQVRNFFYEGNFLCAPTVFAKRGLFEKIGEFHKGLLQLQDLDYWIRALKKDIILEVKGDRLVDYRFRSDGSNLSSYKHLNRADVEAQYLAKEFFKGFDQETLCKAFRNETYFLLNDAQATVKMNIPIWMICHSKQKVRQIGYEYIIESMEAEELGRMFSKVGLNNPGLSKIIGAW